MGGGVSAHPETTNFPNVASPTIATFNGNKGSSCNPSALTNNTCYSKDDSVTISGICTHGSTVELFVSGVFAGTAVCSGITYSISTPTKSSDGSYAISIDQIGTDGTRSQASTAVWTRQTSVAPPTISYPATSPFASALATFTVTGGCQLGSRISVIRTDNTVAASQICETNSQYNINSVSEVADGLYNYTIQQQDQAGNTAVAHVAWQKQALVINPSNPTYTAGVSATLAVSGGNLVPGACPYYTSIKTNGSTGTLSCLNYHAGPIAGTDVIEIKDNLGTILDISITVAAGAADHLVAVGGTLTQSIGGTFSSSPKVKLVDISGNGIPGIQLVYQMAFGDDLFLSSSAVTTDANGFATISVQAGYQQTVNTLSVQALGQGLPDHAGTGNAVLNLTLNSTTASSKMKLGDNYIGGGVTLPGAILVGRFGSLQGDASHVDFAIADRGGSHFTVLQNNGKGAFNPIVFDLGGIGCSHQIASASADFNGDGNQDIVVLCTNGTNASSVALLLADGTGNFLIRSVGNMNFAAQSFAVGNFTSSGKNDIVIASHNLISIFNGNGDGTFQARVDTTVAGIDSLGIALADVDGDGRNELIALNGSASQQLVNIFWTMINGSGVRVLDGNIGSAVPNDPKAAVTLQLSHSPTALVVGSFTGSPYPDIVAGGDNTISIWSRDLSGPSFVYGEVRDIATTPIVEALTSANLQSHGNSDLVVMDSSSYQTASYLNQGNAASFIEVISSTTSDTYKAIAVGDIDGDGAQDLMLTIQGSTNVTQITRGLGLGIFDNDVGGISSGSSLRVGHIFSATSTDAALLAKDSQGKNQIMLVQSSGTGLLKKNMGTPPVPALTENFDSVYLFDLNNDGFHDIVTVDKTAKKINTYINNKDGTFTAQGHYQLTATPQMVVAADFNKDGMLDLGVLSTDSNVTLLLRHFNGSASAVQVITGASLSASLAAADIDGDGNTDLVLTDSGGANPVISILWGVGDVATSFAAGPSFIVGANPKDIVIGRFFGGNLPDIVVFNYDDQTISVLKHTSKQNFSVLPAIALAAPTQGSSLQAADFNGDGLTDLIISNGDNTMTLFKNTGSTFVSSVVSGPDALISEIGVCDINGDSIADLIVLDVTGNKIRTWVGH